MDTNNSIQSNYAAHEKVIETRKANAKEVLSPIKNQDSVFYYLVKRTLKLTEAFTQSKHSWVTIGDFSGQEANYLMNQGQDVLATDISDAILSEAQKEKLITHFQKENVEKISLKDSSYDYVLCKEAYHHFPRAYMGLYEMIRVSKKATILIEPLDIISKMPLLLFIKNVLDRIHPELINKIWKNRFSYENIGNFVFKIAERDIEKIAMGMGLPCIAFKGINLYLPHTIVPEMLVNPIDKKHLKKVLSRLNRKNFLCKLKLIPHDHLCCIVFKEAPDASVIKILESQQFKIIHLPKFPGSNK